MSRFATIAGVGLAGVAGLVWWQILADEGKGDGSGDADGGGSGSDAGDTLGNQGGGTTTLTAGQDAAYNRCNRLHQEGHFPQSYVSVCTESLLAQGMFFYRVKNGEVNKYGRDTEYHAPHLQGKKNASLPGDWERIEAAGTFCGNVGANRGFENERWRVEHCIQSVYDTGRDGPYVDDVSMGLLGR